MKSFVGLVVFFVMFGPLAPLPANAQTYPAKVVRILTNSAAGAPGDIMSRGTAQVLSQVFARPFVVENRPGADAMIAGEACARSAPDGYTLCLFDSLSVVLNPLIRAKMSYDPYRDFAPIMHYGYICSAITVNPSIPANSLQELFELARAKPGTISWGSYGSSSISNMHIEWLRNAKGISFYNVPYKAASLAFAAMLAGEVNVALFSAGQSATQVKAGKAKALAVTRGTRCSSMPDVPTHKEAGLDISIVTSFGLYAPAGTPKDIIQRLNIEVANGIVNDLQRRDKFLTTQGIEIEVPAGGSPEEFAAYLMAERERFVSVVKTAGVKLE